MINSKIKFPAILALPLLLLTACGGGGGGGGGGPADVSPGGNEGSVNSTTGIITPKQITVLPYHGSVLSGTSYYVVKDLTPGAYLDVHLSSVTDDITLSTHTSSSFTGPWCTSNRAGTLSEACGILVSGTGEIYIQVDGLATATADANYTITVLPAAVDEGTLATPTDVSASLPYEGSVAAASNSYYVVSGLTAGQLYDVSLTNMVYQASLSTYPHKDLTAPVTAAAAACAVNNPAWQDETCTLAANFDGKLYIQVIDLTTGTNQDGAHFSLNVSLGSGTSGYFEGYLNTPVMLSTTPYAGNAYGYSSFYQASGLTPGTLYEVHFKNATADGTALDVSGDVGGTTCFRGATLNANFDKWCVATAGDAGNLFIEVGAAYDTVTRYDLDVILAPVSEGTTAAPKAITMPYNGQVDGLATSGASYYVVSGLTANWNYDVLLSNTTRPVTVNVGPSIAGLGSSSTGKTDGSGNLFIKVAGNLTTSGDGAWFTLDIQPGNNPEGSMATPVDISSATETVPHNGQVDDTTSYYVISGLTPGQNYMTRVNNIQISSVSGIVTGAVTVYADNTYSAGAQLCQKSPFAFYTDQEIHCLAPASATGELYVSVSLAWDTTGSSFNLWSVAAEHNSEGSAATPLDIDPLLIISGGGAGPVPYNGHVSAYGSATSYYQVATSAANNYTVSLSNISGNVNLAVANASSGPTDTCISTRAHLLNEDCIIASKAGASVLYIAVTMATPGANDDYWDGAGFTLTLTQSATARVAEGSSGTPVIIPSASLPYSGKTADFAPNYYVITGLSASTLYEISNTNNMPGLATTAYTDASFITPACGARALAKNHSLVNRIACQTSSDASGQLFITVSADGTFMSSDSFSLDVAVAPVAEGSLATPVVIAGTGTRASQVNDPSNASVFSYYHVTGLTAGNAYLAMIVGNTETVNFFIYDDAAFSNVLCNTGATATQCAFTANAAGEAYIRADGYADATHSGSFFDLSVTAEPVAEGTLATPIAVTAGAVYNGQHGGFLNYSYYKVSGLTPNSTHRILVTNMSGDAALKLYEDALLAYWSCDIPSSEVPLGCSAAANAAGELYFTIDGFNASYFDVIVTP